MKNIFTLFFLFLLPILVYTQTNPICNPGFELDLTDWTTYTNDGTVAYSITTEGVYEGTKSLKASVIDSMPWQNRIESCPLSLELNHTYRISFWAKTSVDSAFDIKLVFRNIDAGGTYQGFTIPIMDDTWREYFVSFTADADYPNMTLRFSFVNEVDFFVDKVEISDETFFDCNGVIDGLAYEDNCGECVGGNTGQHFRLQRNRFQWCNENTDRTFLRF